MTLTPETLARHELVGLHVRVADAADPGMVGIGGRVVDETTGTLLIERGDRRTGGRSRAAGAASRVSQVPKRGSTFEFALTDEPADGSLQPAASARKGSGTASEPSGGAAGTLGEGVAHVTVDGWRLDARPAERSETTGDTKWR